MYPRNVIEAIQLILLQIMVWMMLLAIIFTVGVVVLRWFGLDI